MRNPQYCKPLLELDLGVKIRKTALRKSFVIFICAYDPFGKRRYAYTFENRCREDLSLALGDEATKIILNAKGRVEEASAEIMT